MATDREPLVGPTIVETTPGRPVSIGGLGQMDRHVLGSQRCASQKHGTDRVYGCTIVSEVKSTIPLVDAPERLPNELGRQDSPGNCVQEHAHQGMCVHLVPIKAAYKSDHLCPLSTLTDAFRFPLTMASPASPSTGDGTLVSTEQTRPSLNLLTEYFGASSTNHEYMQSQSTLAKESAVASGPLWPRRLRMRYDFCSFRAPPGMGHQVTEFTCQKAIATKFCTFRNRLSVRNTLPRDWFFH